MDRSWKSQSLVHNEAKYQNTSSIQTPPNEDATAIMVIESYPLIISCYIKAYQLQVKQASKFLE